MLTTGVIALLGSDDLLTAFFCGTAFAWDRLPITIILYKFIPNIKTFHKANFTGHFGPMGMGTPIAAFMVLCSITVHGRSIPSFSPGRRMQSISRTWSRRDMLGSTRTEPGSRLLKWTNQARMVSRAEDVAVNCDPGADLEIGESALEKEKQDEEKEQQHSSSSGATIAESVHTMEGVEEEMEGSGLSDEKKQPQQRPPSQEEEGQQPQCLTDKEKQKEGEKYGWVEVTVIHQQDPSLRARWHWKSLRASSRCRRSRAWKARIRRELGRLRARAREAMTGERSTSTESLGHSSGSRRDTRALLELFRNPTSPTRAGKDEKGKEKEERKGEEKISILFSRAKPAELEERQHQQQLQHDHNDQKRLADMWIQLSRGR
ncbi:hypothetical protein CPB84DRAFT_1752432 [Gymnopilus junonius]|uniref:Uncharacterized protein n=1 Tax=Gymnopilus junonius TaxID=109634 RepID=A0A9P5TG07_GYMJU|nr:hypothetical protein CPB84DRAFT_1752432 [Gymnopilus junonius]